MDEKKIEIEVELTFEDFFRAIFWQTLRKTWYIYLLAIVCLPTVILGVYVMIKTGKFSPVIFIPFLPVLGVIVNLYSIYSSAKKSAETTNHKIQWSFYEDGYEIFTPIGKTEASWNGIEEIKETNKDFLIIIQKPIFVIIPKRYFNESQILEFKDLVRLKLGDKASIKD